MTTTKRLQYGCRMKELEEELWIKT